MVGFDGAAPSPEVRMLLRDFGVGNVILFARNVESPEQVADLVRELQESARHAGHDQPLLFAIDQEGGRVARLRAPWTLWPPLRAVGRIGDADLSRRMGTALATELKACGIRWDLAPVVDVDTNPRNPIIGDRSFGDDPEAVGRLAVAMIRGLEDAGVAACAKHFPGHGDTDVDSHLDLPSVEHARSRLEDVELRPFRAAIAAGVASIMTAHVVVRELDDAAPATLSRAVLTDLLRETMGYRGVIVSDDLEMKAVAKHWTPGEAAVGAVRAGCDVLPVCAHVDAQVSAIESVIRALESGDVPWKEFDDSLARVRGLKDRFAQPHVDPDPEAARAAAGLFDSALLSREIADRGGIEA